MKRGDLFRVYKGSMTDTKDFRVFVVISRQLLINSKFSTVVCAPIYSKHDGISTQVSLGADFGLKKDSSIHCDELISILKSKLTDYIGSLSEIKMQELNEALLIALDIN